MIPTEDFTGWHKARASGDNGGGCVEVGYADDGRVALRDTKDRTKPAHVFTADEWRCFLEGARNGEFDI